MRRVVESDREDDGSGDGGREDRVGECDRRCVGRVGRRRAHARQQCVTAVDELRARRALEELTTTTARSSTMTASSGARDPGARDPVARESGSRRWAKRIRPGYLRVRRGDAHL
jgi:hypothetical protein